MIKPIVPSIDISQDAFTELSTLGIIISSTDDDVTLDLQQLYALGYVLIFNLNSPVFTTILDFNYIYNPILFYGNNIPKTALKSFVLSKIKNVGLSP